MHVHYNVGNLERARMQRAIFVTGILIVIPPVSTVGVLLLRRIFPDTIWINYLGPAASAIAVLWFAKTFLGKG
jgi:hypothetical protein